MSTMKKLGVAFDEARREVARLRAENDALRKRVRLARAKLAALVNANLDNTDAIVTQSNVFDVLDLRRPLPRGRR